MGYYMVNSWPIGRYVDEISSNATLIRDSNANPNYMAFTVKVQASKKAIIFSGGSSNSDSSNGSFDSNRNSQSGSAQSRSATRPNIVDSLFEATGTEKPKDTAGWIELGVKSFASWNRNKGNGNK